MFCQVRLFLLLSPQSPKAQVQTGNSIFSVANEDRKLKQIYDIRGGKEQIKQQHNAQGITLHLFSEISPLLFSLPPNQFCDVT
jgi:hypothetical protein